MTQSQRSHRKDEHVFLAEKSFQATAHAGFDQFGYYTGHFRNPH